MSVLARPQRLAALQTLAVDAQTVQVMQLLQRRGIEPVLLKGPALDRLLYGDGEARTYLDTDLLVSPRALPVAERALRELGYLPVGGDPMKALMGAYGYPWLRPGSRLAVDLHHTLSGVEADPDELWAALRAHTAAIRLQGADLRTLDATALAFHLALHAAHHGAVLGHKPLGDLGRAVAQLPVAEWRAAAALAERVDALDAFAAGMRMLPAGAALAAELDLAASTRRATLTALGAPPVALTLDRVRTSPGVRAKLGLLVAKAFPPPYVMRHRMALARRRPGGLAIAYPWRLLQLAGQIVPAVVAWRRAAARGSAEPSTAVTTRRERA